MGKINRRVMMIGGAITPPRIPMDWTWRQMAAEVFWNALQDAGVSVPEVDMVACNYNDRTIVDSSPGSQIADALGILPKPVVAVANACAGNGIASYVAWNAVASGRCDIVVSMGFARSDNYDAMESMNSQGNYVDFDYMLGMTHINYGAIRDAYYKQKYEVSLRLLVVGLINAIGMRSETRWQQPLVKPCPPSKSCAKTPRSRKGPSGYQSRRGCQCNGFCWRGTG